MNYYSTHCAILVSCYTSNVEQQIKIDKFLDLLSRSGACELIQNAILKEEEKGGRPAVNPFNLFAAILYCFAFEKASLRNIEEKIIYDLRLVYIMQGETPTYRTIGNFINKILLPNQKEIFKLVTLEIIRTCNVDIKNIFIDGSKFEANANKYKFVWKPTTFHLKLSDKIRKLLESIGLSNGIPKEGIIPSKLIAEKCTEIGMLYKNSDLTIKKNKKQKADIETMIKFLNKNLDYEEKEKTCGPSRNSYFKTDHDATAMCLKQDYYSGLGSSLHAAYNTQIAVSKGFVVVYYLSQSRNDLNDFIPVLSEYYINYGFYPDSVGADAGYGNEDNYLYMEEHKIKSFVKYNTWEGNVSGTRPSQFVLNDNNTVTCLNGNIGIIDKDCATHHKKKETSLFIINGCLNCNFSAYCKRYMKEENKKEDYKRFEVNINLQRLIQESERNLLSPEGIEMRVNRSIQVEGVFGIIKQNFGYTRFRRRNIKKVALEFMLVCLGNNIRKLFRFYDGKLDLTFWKLPENTKPEIFKKPSAKKLSKKALKIKPKSKNEVAKKSYKYNRNK